MVKGLKTVTIATGVARSEKVDLENFELVGVITPDTLDGTVTALEVKAADGPNATFDPVFDDAGTEVSITIAGSQVVGIGTAVKANALRGLKYIQIEQVTGAGAAVNAAAPRIYHLLLARRG